MMHLRALTIFAVAFGMLAADAGPGRALPNGDPEERYTGGAPLSKLFKFFGATIRRETVNFAGKYTPGTVVVNTTERRLYYILADGRAIKYGIGVGRDGFRWAGDLQVSMKKEWPDWTPPPQMLARRPDLPRFMKGGEENPLGARAIYLGSSLFRIHGTNEEETIGQAVSSGCFRMINADVIDLYDRIKIGARVVVLR